MKDVSSAGRERSTKKKHYLYAQVVIGKTSTE